MQSCTLRLRLAGIEKLRDQERFLALQGVANMCQFQTQMLRVQLAMRARPEQVERLKQRILRQAGEKA